MVRHSPFAERINRAITVGCLAGTCITTVRSRDDKAELAAVGVSEEERSLIAGAPAATGNLLF